MEGSSAGLPLQHAVDVESSQHSRPSSGSGRTDDTNEFTDDMCATRWLTFLSLAYRKDYTCFLMDETSPVLSAVVAVMTYYVYTEYSVEQFLSSSRITVFLAALRHARTATVVPVLVYGYCIAQSRYPALPKLPFNIVTVGNIILLSHSILNGLIVLARALIGGCENHVWGCNPAAAYNSIPLDAAIFCAYSMIAIPIMIKCHSWVVNCCAIVALSSLLFAALAVVGASSYTFVSTGLFSVTTLLALYDYERYSIRLFIENCKLRREVQKRNRAENEKSIIARHTEELKQLIGNVAHDLKTPLQAFSLEIETLAGVPELGSKSQASIDVLRSTCSVMMMMINRSIDYMKATSGLVMVPRLETVCLPESISWVLGCIGSAREGVSIVAHPIPAEIHSYILTDKQWLLENLLCLTSNAVKFICRGTIDIRVCLVPGEKVREGVDRQEEETTSPGAIILNAQTEHPLYGGDAGDTASMLQIEVEDTGIGIDPAARSRLFQPFNQAQRHAGGTGLGLFALSKRVDSIGGTCGVAGRRDGAQGSLFWFRIPYRPDTSVVYDVEYSSGEGAELSLPSGAEQQVAARADTGQSVLVVDDSLLIQKTASRALRREGFAVTCVGNGAECLEALEVGQYDIVLLDINMPVMDGYETIKRLRRLEKDSGDSRVRQVVIGCSANSDAATREQATSLGMDGFVEKPLNVSALQASFQQVLQVGGKGDRA